ncbi:FAD-dependent oxidoreductase [Nocardioides sp. AN3]
MFYPNHPCFADVDVLVVGSGAAGASAAIAAAREGARVLLIERNGFLGGNSTATLDSFHGLFHRCGRGHARIVGGISHDVVGRLVEMDRVLQRVKLHGGLALAYNPSYLKVVWDQLVLDAGVTVLLHTVLQDAEVVDGRVVQVLVATKSGLQRVKARQFIDASGDADLVHFAGFGYDLAGDGEPAYDLTTTFTMAGVDVHRRHEVSWKEIREIQQRAADSRAYDVPTKFRVSGDHAATLPGTMAAIMTQIPSVGERDGVVVNATDPELLTGAEIAGRRQVLEFVRFLRQEVPGYEEAELSGFGSQIGAPETRRIRGAYTITRDDVLNAQQFDDQIAMFGSIAAERFRDLNMAAEAASDDVLTVGIPWRALLPVGATNLVVAGRCFSTSHDAQASARSMGQCIAMGHAAGVGAAVSAAKGSDLCDLDVSYLRGRLRDQRAVLDVDDITEFVPMPSTAHEEYVPAQAGAR